MIDKGCFISVSVVAERDGVSFSDAETKSKLFKFLFFKEHERLDVIDGLNAIGLSRDLPENIHATIPREWCDESLLADGVEPTLFHLNYSKYVGYESSYVRSFETVASFRTQRLGDDEEMLVYWCYAPTFDYDRLTIMNEAFSKATGFDIFTQAFDMETKQAAFWSKHSKKPKLEDCTFLDINRVLFDFRDSASEGFFANSELLELIGIDVRLADMKFGPNIIYDSLLESEIKLGKYSDRYNCRNNFWE